MKSILIPLLVIIILGGVFTCSMKYGIPMATEATPWANIERLGLVLGEGEVLEIRFEEEIYTIEHAGPLKRRLLIGGKEIKIVVSKSYGLNGVFYESPKNENGRRLFYEEFTPQEGRFASNPEMYTSVG